MKKSIVKFLMTAAVISPLLSTVNAYAGSGLICAANVGQLLIPGERNGGTQFSDYYQFLDASGVPSKCGPRLRAMRPYAEKLIANSAAGRKLERSMKNSVLSEREITNLQTTVDHIASLSAATKSLINQEIRDTRDFCDGQQIEILGQLGAGNRIKKGAWRKVIVACTALAQQARDYVTAVSSPVGTDTNPPTVVKDPTDIDVDAALIESIQLLNGLFGGSSSSDGLTQIGTDLNSIQ